MGEKVLEAAEAASQGDEVTRIPATQLLGP